MRLLDSGDHGCVPDRQTIKKFAVERVELSFRDQRSSLSPATGSMITGESGAGPVAFGPMLSSLCEQ
jgi:hypothetical protein